MSEHTYSHYRTGTFPVTVTGVEGQSVVEARWVRDHHIVHLFVPQIEGTAAGAVTLGALPATIRPSRSEVFPVPVRSGALDGLGLLAFAAGGGHVEARAQGDLGTLAGAVRIGPCAVHYLSIPGQMEDARGVMRMVPEGEMPPEPEPVPEPVPEPEPEPEPEPAEEGAPAYA